MMKNDERSEIEFDSIERLSVMSRDQIDDLPYGFMVLDGEGNVMLYNRYEAAMSRLDPARVVGKNFFARIAPCTRVQAFEGRFRDLVRGDGPSVERFAFRFRFEHGAQDVLVQFARTPDRDRIFLTVLRRSVSDRVLADRLEPTRLDEQNGAVTGPQGDTLATPVDALLGMIARSTPEQVRDLGWQWGRSIARAADRHAYGEHGAPLHETLPLDAMRLVDLALTNAGLGRVSADLGRRGEGALEFVVRPAWPHGGELLARLYERILEPIASAADPRDDLRVACLDIGSIHVLPWRFVADRADAIAERVRRRDAGEGTDAIG